NLYEQQLANRRKTWLIMAGFVAILLVIGIGFDALYLDLESPVPIGSIAAVALGSVSALATYYSGDRAVLLATGAKPIAEVEATATDSEKLKLRQLDNIVDEMA